MARTPKAAGSPTDHDEVTGSEAETPVSKGRPTPSRKQQEAARKQPLVPSDRRAAGRTSREQQASARDRARVGMARGEEKYLPARDKGVQKRFARDYVDARWNLGEALLPILVLVIITYAFPAIAGYVIIAVWIVLIHR